MHYKKSGKRESGVLTKKRRGASSEVEFPHPKTGSGIPQNSQEFQGIPGNSQSHSWC